VLTRTMKKIAGIAETAGAKLRDRTRSVRHHVLNIARAARSKSQQNRAKLSGIYGKLLAATGRVVGQAKRAPGSSPATPTPKARSSACSSRRPKSSARARPASRLSSAKW
jgi:hypothetical protein